MKTSNISRKLNIFLVIIASGLILTGCKNNFDHMPDLTEDERKVIAYYIADIMVKHDKNNGKLVTDYEIKQYDEKEAQKQANLEALLATRKTEEADSDESKNSSNSNSDGEDITQVKVYTPIRDILNLNAISIYPEGFRITDSYPDDNTADTFFALDASNGNKLLVVSFIATNETGSDQTLDIFSDNVKFKVGINDDYPRLTMSTMLLDDMSMYRGIIPGGSQERLVLLREISPEEAQNIQNVTIEAVKDGITYYIQ